MKAANDKTDRPGLCAYAHFNKVFLHADRPSKVKWKMRDLYSLVYLHQLAQDIRGVEDVGETLLMQFNQKVLVKALDIDLQRREIVRWKVY